MTVPIITSRVGSAYPLSIDEERSLKEKHLPTVQALAATGVGADDFHLRGMYLCNSARDYYYSRFTVGALDEIAGMLVGRPVMVGHNYGTLPVGRFVTGKRIEREGRAPKRDRWWVEGLFYLPRDAEGDAIAKRIDQGIYREVSIGWRCLDATCNICRNDIRDRDRCEHIPGELYDQGLCEYQFSGITAVLEGSLVFAGGQKDTSTFTPAGERGATWQEWAAAPQLRDSDLPAFKRSAVLDAEGILDAATRSHRQEERQRTSVQSVVCSKSRFGSEAEAARWARDHDFRADKVDATDDSFRFRQFEPTRCKDDSFRTIEMDEGVKAVICKKANSGEGRCMSVEQFLKGR